MRRLTFEGYLKSYVPYLAGQETQSVSQLARLAQSEPRLLEPLVLWAAVTGRAGRLAPRLPEPCWRRSMPRVRRPAR